MNSKKETSASPSTNELKKELAAITSELSRKNRDLEIEASLERVRAVAMDMNQSNNLLSICETMFHELKKLGFDDLRNAMIDIHYEAKAYLLNYDYSDNAGKTITTFKYNSHPIVDNLIYHAKQSSESFTEMIYSGKALDEWRIFRKQNGEADDIRLDNIDALFYYFYSIGTGAIGISTFSAANPEQLNVLKRFRNVFDLAYRRYTDIKLAENQAREAQIELGLERVRTRAMAMQSSGELADLVTTLFNELAKLDFALSWCMINIIDGPSLSNTVWAKNADAGGAPESFHMKFEGYPFHDAMWREWKERNAKYVYTIEGEEKRIYDEYLFNQTEFSRLPETVKAGMRATERYVASFSFSNFGGLQTVGDAPLPDASLDILSRFGKVFDLTYTRFNDLKQAEEQAREAQIELALERVRARTMAMQHSDELVDAAAILFKQVKDLSVEVWTCGFQIWKPGEPGTTVAYMTLPDGTIRVPFDIPHPPEPFLNRAYEAAERGDQFYVEEIGGEALAAHYKYMLALPGASDRMVDISAGGFHLPEFQVNHNAYFSQGALLFITYKPVPQSWDIFKRFAKVFEQTYTRFLDLKKAEAQAREALIEGALERVRSRAMAMHKTDELGDAAELLYKELIGLGIDSLSVCYVLVNEHDKTGAYYGINPVDGKMMLIPMIAPHTETKEMRALWASWLKQEPVHFIALDPEASIVHQTYIGKLMAATFAAHGIAPEFTVEGFLSVSPERIHIYSLNFKQGYLFLVGGAPLAAAEIDILTRFTKVFELTYTRFLDIQKAEAQAREGRIELALERVRARTMAMQHSDELAETAYILFQQFRELGENPDQATIGIINEAEGVIEYWVTIYGNQTNRMFKFPVDEPDVTRKIYDAWKAQEKSLVIDLSGQALYDFSKFRESMGGAGYNEAEQRRIINVAFFSKGLINVQSTVTRSAESLRLLERFANVFEGTYTRFLDLKKAEAQAREAQIELALERVRARAMAMRDSKELSSMVSTVFSELTKLDFSLTRCAIVIADADSLGRMIWMANSEAGQPPSSFFRKSLDHPYPNAATEEWKKRTPKWVYHLKGAEKKGMDDYYANSEEVAHMSNEIRQAMGTPDSIILSHSFNNFGYLRADSLEPLSEANLEILYRFAKVFDLGYTRFTDIKQAEAQAREAQIELALERVRAKTMAMQHSDELLETSQVVFQQLRDLGETADQISIAIVKEDEGIFDLFATIYGTQMVRVVHPKIDDHFIMGRVYKNWKAHKKSFVVELSGEELRRYNILRNQLGGVDYYNEVIGPDDRWIVSAACFSNGILSFSSSTEPTKEAALLLERFAKVFDSTYTRFLDLQKAEAQARESQIQLALERVRARTMAMQRSEELPETANLLFTQVQELGMPAWSAGYCNWTDNKKAITFWMSSEGVLQPPFSMPTTEDPSSIHMREAAERGETFYVEEVGGEALVKHYEYMRTLPVVGEVLDSIINAGHPLPTFQIFHLAYFAHGFLLLITYEPVPEAHDIFKRFAKVFEQTYTRFLDLQKAEAQARESQIQLALERVRARTMAMQKSDELAETVSLVFKQLLALGIRTEQIRTCGIVTFNDNEPLGEQWITETNGEIIPKSFMVPYDEAPAYKAIYKAWKDGEKFMVIHLEGKALKEHLGYLAKGTNVPTRDVVLPRQAKEIFNHVLFFSQGCLFIITKEALPGYHEVFKRFGAVFQQSYTRFLDLQKAEAQAREGQIQLAMERVRARTMAMQHSDELMEASHLLDSQVRALGIETRGCAFNIYGENESTEWFGLETGPLVYKTPREEAFLLYYEAGQRGDSLYINEFAGDACKAHYEYLCTLPDVGDALKKMRDNGQPFPAYQIDHVVYFKFGYLLFITFEPVPEAHDIFKRFAAVFEQTYTRFLDLQKAETQAREAKIEAALEKIRSRSLAMHQSVELLEVVTVVFEKLQELEVPVTSAGMHIYIEGSKDADVYVCGQNQNRLIISSYRLPFFDHPIEHDMFNGWQKGLDFLVKTYSFEEKNSFYNYLFDHSDLKYLPVDVKDLILQSGDYTLSMAFSKNSMIVINHFDGKLLSEMEIDIIKRFAKVFEQAYVRFLDLQKAEAQTREAEIELGLERVRARTMAMQKSHELQEIIKVVYEQLVHLNIPVEHTGFIIDYNTRDDMHIWLTDKHYAPAEITVPYFDCPHWNGFNEAKEKGKDFFAIHSTFEEKNKFYQDLFKLVPGATDETKEYYFSCPGLAISTVLLENVGLYIENFSGTAYTADENSTLMRFGKVFQQTYTRFLDLQRAEAQAREAVKQASLDRVRGEIASMRTTTDLDRITPLIWNELTILAIPFIRCGVFIVDEAEEVIHTHLSTPNGKALAAFNLAFDADGIGQTVLSAWRRNEMATGHWTAEEFATNTKNLVDQGAVTSKERFVTEHPDTSLDLHFFPFLQGMLYVGNIAPLSHDAKNLVQSLAEAFSTAYARYEDFSKLEAAKQQVDKTLTDLKAAQTQLIQTEKMASLGELTAGIAHEIQNPLNFVNNFSEVNAELIEEMKAEIEKGDLEEIKALALDIEENSKKINQHGKRADGIVKGMLQHSQSGSGVKELTNINAVADEYMRLAYHGLRAKDKSFNAEMHTYFDPSLPKINIIPQDIGRVLLNLFNNAFYAVNQKMKTAGGDYKPMVEVETFFLPLQRIAGLKVKDNGIGIPDAIKEKIMQPFFTTKPTGEGTGLGLSLTYDMVVKGHGGSIQVNSAEGEGSEFIIKLPIS